MSRSWALFLIPPAVTLGGLLILTQGAFLSASFHEDLGLGRSAPEFTLANYVAAWNDPDYRASLALTLRLAASVVAVTLVLSWPVAYLLSRSSARLATAVIVAVVASSFVTLPIKALGLMILFSADGTLMRALRTLDLVGADYRFVGSLFAVAVGYSHLAIGFMVTILFSVFQGIPRRLEEAAAVHGASPLRVLWRVVVPLSLPGTLSASLVLFNLLCGAFVSAVLLGGGKVLTLSVLIQRSLILFNEYGSAATLATVLLVLVFIVNIASVVAVTRLGPARRIIV